jgi:hypothetical protein
MVFAWIAPTLPSVRRNPHFQNTKTTRDTTLFCNETMLIFKMEMNTIFEHGFSKDYA